MTIAQQLKVTEFPFVIKDNKGNQIYFENSNGYWSKREFDSNGNQIYYESITGFWYKKEFDSTGDTIYYENSYCTIIDNRPKPVTELTMDQISEKFNIPVSQLKITNPDVNKRREVDSIPKDKRTFEEKMIYLIDHSEVIDESYFRSESGNIYEMGDKRINCLIRSYPFDKPIYRSGHIKLNEIGFKYKLVEDKYNDDYKIVIEEIWTK